MVEINAIWVAAFLFIFGSCGLSFNVRGWFPFLIQWVFVAACFVGAGYLLGKI